MSGWWVSCAWAASRALLVDTSTQPAGSVWAGADLADSVPLMRDALERRGFTDVRTLTGATADVGALRDALDRLVAESQPGDVVVFYYTGHGAQAVDDDKDEPDGLDELLVPYGADHGVATDVTGYLRDDELADRWDQLAERVGAEGHVLAIFDACYSGGASRGLSDPGALIARRIGADVVATGTDVGSGVDGSGRIVIVAASRYDQLARWVKTPDGVAAGVLTHALAPLLATAGPDLSYQLLGERLRAEFERRDEGQIPQVEGAIGATVLRGSGAQTPYFPLDAVDGKIATIHAGSLSGVTVGAEFVITPPGTRSLPDEATWSVATVQSTTETTAELALSKSAAPGSWALWSKRGEAPTLRVALHRSLRSDAALREALAGIEGIAWVDDAPDATLSKTRDGLELRMADADGGVVTGPLSPSDPGWASFRSRMEGLAWQRSLRTLRLEDDVYAVRIDRLWPVTSAGEPCQIERVDGPRPTEDTTAAWTARVGDALAFEVGFAGDEDAWLTVLAFEPEGSVVPLWPAADTLDRGAQVKHGFLVPIGQESCLRFDTPGTYVIKAYATSEPLDLTALQAAVGGAGRGSTARIVGRTSAVNIEVRP